MLTAVTTRRRPRSRPSTWKTRAPVQDRSRATLERFAAAAETLLRDRPFEHISVHEIAACADRPIGSFYARFASKDALLPFLYERYDRTLEGHLSARLVAVDWAKLDFAAAIGALVGVLVGIYEERRWLLRALALFARQSPEALSDALVARRQRLYDGVTRILLAYERDIRHPEPAEAIRFGVFFVSAVARDRLLFSEAPHARATALPVERLRAELTQALHAYLAMSRPSP